MFIVLKQNTKYMVNQSIFYVCSQQGDWSTGSVYGQLYYQYNRR